ncbi:MAG: meiotic recombination [Caeruleum heppii]|nr:MAG: meiotic recombination [Caeruleum heppii]
MPGPSSADTIRILVATDSHVGYNERDPIRGDDSWKSFHEVMCLAKDQEVDMVLLAGDLFHENKPSRKSMYQVMRSLRMNCYGEKPCELEMLSDASESFQGAFNHVNYEDPDINVAIPVFSIHGNHDDPSGEGHLCALDLLQVSGLVNYYGRTPESDNIAVKPVLLQKGRTKLALYGMSNVRDERLFRTFRNGRVKFFRPEAQQENWFNLMAVHQNHHAYTETGFLPENFLPDFMDFIVWGHEHECLIDPKYNPEMAFHVMQPGSSVATSLVPGEAVTKRVGILSITGRDFDLETHRLKTVRPFVMKEMVLNEDKEMKDLAKQENNRSDLTRHLEGVVEDLIKEANQDWVEAQGEVPDEEELEPPLPLIRLRVEYSAPDGGKFECENPQRFSNRFVGKVANVNDVVQFYRKKMTAARTNKNSTDLPSDSIMAQLSIDNIRVEKLVREFLTAQSLTILPQNSFGDAVSQYVDKDDKHAMEMFVNESLANQIKHLLQVDPADAEDEAVLHEAIGAYRSKLEELFAKGGLNRRKKAKLKPRPDNWDSDIDGEWADQPGALMLSDNNDNANGAAAAPRTKAAPTSRARGGKATTAASTTRQAPVKRAAAAKPAARGKKSTVVDDDEGEMLEAGDDAPPSDVIMLDNDDDDDIIEEAEPDSMPAAFSRANRSSVPAKIKSSAPKKTSGTSAKGSAPAPITTRSQRAPTRAAAAASQRQSGTGARQARLDFSQAPSTATVGRSGLRGSAGGKTQEPLFVQSADEISSDDDDEDEDAFEPAPLRSSGGRGGRKGKR